MNDYDRSGGGFMKGPIRQCGNNCANPVQVFQTLLREGHIEIPIPPGGWLIDDFVAFTKQIVKAAKALDLKVMWGPASVDNMLALHLKRPEP